MMNAFIIFSYFFLQLLIPPQIECNLQHPKIEKKINEKIQITRHNNNIFKSIFLSILNY